MRRVAALVLAIAVCTLLRVSADTVNWPQFRGPGSLGVGQGRGLPERWSTTENVVWRTDIPGHGWSSPVVWGDRIFVTSVVSADGIEPPKKGLYFGGERPASTAEHRWMIYGIDFATGRVVWEREAHRARPPGPRHLKNTYASETPVTDGERVYAQFGNVGLFCYDLTGRPLWSRRWDAAPTRNGWGTAASPVLHDGRIYVVNDNDARSFLIALDAKTGRTVWEVERREGTNWATPFVWANRRRTEIVTSGTGGVRSYDLNGKMLWQLGPMSSIVIPTPFAAFDLLYVTSGYVGDTTRPVYAVRAGASGDIVPGGEFVAWHLPQGGPYNPSPLVYGDEYYTLFDRGFLTAHDARTGKEVYGKVRIDPEAGAFTASPWAYNGKVFALSEDGVTYVIQAGPQYKLLGRNTLDEFTMATPAIARDSLIIRTATKLYRIAETATRGEP